MRKKNAFCWFPFVSIHFVRLLVNRIRITIKKKKSVTNVHIKSICFGTTKKIACFGKCVYSVWSHGFARCITVLSIMLEWIKLYQARERERKRGWKRQQCERVGKKYMQKAINTNECFVCANNATRSIHFQFRSIVYNCVLQIQIPTPITTNGWPWICKQCTVIHCMCTIFDMCLYAVSNLYPVLTLISCTKSL